jgi:hypothetical protein
LKFVKAVARKIGQNNNETGKKGMSDHEGISRKLMRKLEMEQ